MKGKNNKIPLSIPFIDFNEKKLILDSIKNNEISTFGRNVAVFEKKISRLTGGKFNLALNSGSSALLIAFKSLGLKKDDLVITQSYTFTATTNAIKLNNATPLLFDISLISFSASHFAFAYVVIGFFSLKSSSNSSAV